MDDERRLVLPSDEGRHGFVDGDVDMPTLCRVCGRGKRDELHKAPLLLRLCQAIEQAITSEDGLDGDVGGRLLQEVGYYPPRLLPAWTREQMLDYLRQSTAKQSERV